MNKKELTAELTVGPQIQPDDLQALADSGFRSIICNRPDGEASDQPTFAQISTAAKAMNIEAKYLPVVPGIITDQDVENFSNALLELPHPTFAYCRTGFRSKKLWSLGQQNDNALSILLSGTERVVAQLSRVLRRNT